MTFAGDCRFGSSEIIAARLRAARGPRALSAIALSLSIFATDARAQARAAFPRAEVGVSLGVARNSPVGTHLGAMPEINHLFLGIDVTVPLGPRDHRWTVAYAPEIVPLLVLSNVPQVKVSADGFLIPIDIAPRERDTGFAISPIGLEGELRLSPRWRLYFASAVGCVWFSHPVPTPRASAFNYTAEWGGGMLLNLNRTTALKAGYKFHHLSNAYRAYENPGVDGNVLVVGVARAFGQ